MITQLTPLHQRNMDLVLTALRDSTSLGAVYDADVPTDWDTYKRPCGWVSEQGYDPGDREGATSHLFVEVSFQVSVVFDYSVTNPDREMNKLGRRYLAEIEHALADLQKDPELFDVRQGRAAFGETPRQEIGGLVSDWTISYTAERLNRYAPEQS
jgi:hypothetical protein